MVQYLGGEAETAAQKTGKFAIVSAIKTVAIAAGAAIIAVGIYILAATKSADAGEAVEGIFVAGAAIGGAIWKGADEINSSMNEGIKSGEEKKKLDMRIYRLVRFMPEFIELKRESKCFDCKSVSLPKLGPTQVVFEQSLN
jgi:hypothetical protein